MSLNINTKLTNNLDGHLIDAKNVKGTYVVVSNYSELANLPAATIVEGTLVFCQSDITISDVEYLAGFYQYHNSQWEEVQFGTEVIANPTLAGTEADLTGLQVGDTKYKVPSGGSDLPTVVNDRYLHTNATTGALEWSQVQGGQPNNLLLIDIIGEKRQDGGYGFDQYLYGDIEDIKVDTNKLIEHIDDLIPDEALSFRYIRAEGSDEIDIYNDNHSNSVFIGNFIGSERNLESGKVTLSQRTLYIFTIEFDSGVHDLHDMGTWASCKLMIGATDLGDGYCPYLEWNVDGMTDWTSLDIPETSSNTKFTLPAAFKKAIADGLANLGSLVSCSNVGTDPVAGTWTNLFTPISNTCVVCEPNQDEFTGLIAYPQTPINPEYLQFIDVIWGYHAS